MNNRNSEKIDDKIGFQFDFHIHSKFSFDSTLTPEKIIKISLKKGLNGIAITDHEAFKGANEASKMANSDFLSIVGEEVKTEYGDVIGLFLTEELKSRRFSELVDEIKDQDGLVILPHPYKGKKEISEDIINNVDLIEVLNGRIAHELNIKAEKLATKHQKPMIGGSDAHLGVEIGKVRTLIFADQNEINDVSNLKKLLLEGNSKVIGKESGLKLKYLSVVIGNIRKGQPLNLGRSLIKKIR